MKSGIYKITNTLSGKLYVGSAHNLNSRKSEHFSRLRKGSHENQRLQNSFTKYGEENFTFEVIEYCVKEIVIQREQHYLDTLKPFFNICKTAGNTAGRVMSKEARLKMSLAKKGVTHDPEVVRRRSEKMKGRIYSEESINNMKEGIRNMPPEVKEERRKKLKDKALNRSKETLERIARGRWKPVVQKDLDGNSIRIWDCAQQVQEVLGISKVSIGACCKNKVGYKTAGGFKWEFARDILSCESCAG